MTKDELKPIDTSKYKITETGQVLKRTKDEIKDKMKDKISMALKDPILQMGFEVICSKLSRLEKENAELKEKAVKARKRLTKAKEIIKDFMTVVKSSHTTVCGVPEENCTINVLKLNEEAEQFIKE